MQTSVVWLTYSFFELFGQLCFHLPTRPKVNLSEKQLPYSCKSTALVFLVFQRQRAETGGDQQAHAPNNEFNEKELVSKSFNVVFCLFNVVSAPLSNTKYFSTTSHAVGGRATSPRPATPLARQMGTPELPQEKPYMPPPSPTPGSPVCSECGKHIVWVTVTVTVTVTPCLLVHPLSSEVVRWNNVDLLLRAFLNKCCVAPNRHVAHDPPFSKLLDTELPVTSINHKHWWFLFSMW